MITFVTLILSLVTGALSVEVAATAETAEVEYLLDGVSVGVDRQPPWRLEVDFGPRLAPHELVAVARDVDGRELGRARQLVNLPRPDAEVEIVLERDGLGNPVAARVVTVNVAQQRPYALSVIIDGRLLEVGRNGRVDLQGLDPDRPHLLQVEAAFLDGTVARRELSFGGVWGREVRTELTAVPVLVGDPRGEPPATQIASRLRSDGQRITVAAVDQPGHRLFVVRDEASLPTLQRHAWALDRRMRRHLGSGGRLSMDDITVPQPDPEADLTYIVRPIPESVGSRRHPIDLFPVSEAFDPPRSRGLPWLLGWVRPVGRGGEQRLAEAVAVSGVRAAGTGAPRAVVLVVSSDARDPGAERVAEVRRYLAAIGVPLYVWATDREAPAGWGEADDVSTASRLRAAARRVTRDLERQWIAWIEGEHLPHRLAFHDTEELRLVR